MKLGGATYCDQCTVEIVSGTHCSSCDPENGSSDITYTFVVSGEMSPEAQQSISQAQPEKQGFFSWLRNGGK